MLKLSVQRRLNEIQNSNDWKRVVKDIWSALYLHYVQSLHVRLPGQIQYELRVRCHIIKS